MAAFAGNNADIKSLDTITVDFVTFTEPEPTGALNSLQLGVATAFVISALSF